MRSLLRNVEERRDVFVVLLILRRSWNVRPNVSSGPPDSRPPFSSLSFSSGSSVSAAALRGSAGEHAALPGSQSDPPPAGAALLRPPLAIGPEERKEAGEPRRPR